MSLVPAAVANYLLGVVYQLTGSPLNFFPALFATIIIAVALQSLFMVTMATNLSPSFDKWCSLFFAVLSGAAAASVLLVAPRGLLNIDTTGATRAFSHASAAVLSQRGWEPDAQVQHGQGAGVQPVVLEVGLALLGAVLGGLLLTPIMRIMRSFATALEVPEWATQQLRYPAWLPFSLNLNLMLPALAMIVWVNPLFQEPLGIPQAWMPGIKAGVLTSISLVQLANTRSLVQSYLDIGLKQWHTLKHGSLGRAAAAGTATGAVIKKKLMVVNGLFVKVAIQCLSPPTILLGCAMIIMQPNQDGVLPSRGKAKPAEILQIPISFWICIADFCGWWTCTCWFAVSVASLSLIRLGLLQA
ncbi:hypothetical protein ABBQ38_003438 [Trebouxia sp. C0009 RCD-2024]